MADPDRPLLQFFVASCQYPAGLLDLDMARASLDRLASYDRLTAQGNPVGDPMFMLGDQIYADAVAGLMNPKSWRDWYDARYESAAHLRADVWSRRVVYALPDDHEFVDNWEPFCRNDWKACLDHGLAAYRRANPSIQNGLRYGPVASNPFDNCAFLLDTRTEREHRHALNWPEAQIMSRDQWIALKAWLVTRKDEPGPAFIACPAIVLPKRLASAGDPSDIWRSDSWCGYPASMNELLEFILTEQIPNVVFLSGDEHLTCLCQATLSSPERANLKPIRVVSLHAPGLYAPYPFANGRAENFKTPDAFDLPYGTDGLKVVTKVAVESTVFPANGDGFLVVQVVTHGDHRFTLRVVVDGERGKKTYLYRSDVGSLQEEDQAAPMPATNAPTG